MLKVENLHFEYQGGRFRLEVPDFSLSKGEVILIKGFNGSGKSTFLKLLAGILKFSDGSVIIEGTHIHKYDGRLYTKIGYLRQQPENFLNVTVKELIAMGRYPYNINLRNITYSQLKNCATVLRQCELYGLRNNNIIELSCGQLQMCFWAKLLFQNPQIFLLDEPFNNLDERNLRIVLQNIKELKDTGKSFIISTHMASFYDINFDRVYEFADGKLQVDS